MSLRMAKPSEAPALASKPPKLRDGQAEAVLREGDVEVGVEHVGRAQAHGDGLVVN